MRTVLPRVSKFKAKQPVFRTPPEISDLIYQTFNSLAHGSKLVDGVAVWANRAIREESFSKAELRSIRAILTSESPEAAVSIEILGSDTTLGWIEEVLAGKVAAVN